MDNLCHSLVGLALARAGGARWTPRATATLVIGANLPDLDAVFAFAPAGLMIRRGITHGLPALAILPFVLTVAMRAWDRWRPSAVPVVPRRLVALALLGVWSHPALDWLNTYGMRWLMPIDGTWFYGDALFIVDPWLLVVLGVGAWLARRRTVRWPAQLAIGLSVAYILGMLWLTAEVRQRVREATGAQAKDVLVSPVFAASWQRTVVVARPDRYEIGQYDATTRPALRLHEFMMPRGLEHAPAVAQSTDPRARAFLGWARFPFYRREGTMVIADDIRYSTGAPSFARVVVPGVMP